MNGEKKIWKETVCLSLIWFMFIFHKCLRLSFLSWIHHNYSYFCALYCCCYNCRFLFTSHFCVSNPHPIQNSVCADLSWDRKEDEFSRNLSCFGTKLIWSNQKHYNIILYESTIQHRINYIRYILHDCSQIRILLFMYGTFFKLFCFLSTFFALNPFDFTSVFLFIHLFFY